MVVFTLMWTMVFSTMAGEWFWFGGLVAVYLLFESGAAFAGAFPTRYKGRWPAGAIQG